MCFIWRDTQWVYPCLGCACKAFVFYQLKPRKLSPTEITLPSCLNKMIGNLKCFPFGFPERVCFALLLLAEDQILKIGFWDSSAQNRCQLFSRKHKLFHRALKLIQLNITSTLNQIKILKGQRNFWYIYYTGVILLYTDLGHHLRPLELKKILQLSSDSFGSSYKVLSPVCNELQNQTMLKTKIPVIVVYLLKVQVCFRVQMTIQQETLQPVLEYSECWHELISLRT